MRAPISIYPPIPPSVFDPLARAWTPAQSAIDRLLHAPRIEKAADARYALPEVEHGRPNTIITDEVTRVMQELFPTQTLSAIGFWGKGRENSRQAIDVRVGFLLKSAQGEASMVIAEMSMPKNTVTPSDWDSLATWALDNKITVAKGHDGWSWASPKPSADIPHWTTVMGLTDHLDMQDGLLGGAARQIAFHLKHAPASTENPSVEVVRRPRP